MSIYIRILNETACFMPSLRAAGAAVQGLKKLDCRARHYVWARKDGRSGYSKLRW